WLLGDASVPSPWIVCVNPGARRPAGKARRPSISGIYEGEATPPGGMPRPGVMPRTAGTRHEGGGRPVSIFSAVIDHLDAGRAALGRGDWQSARAAFESTLLNGDNAEALEGLGLAAWWLDLS